MRTWILLAFLPSLAAASDAPRYPDAQITERNAPLFIQVCDGPKNCREAQIGIVGGKLVSQGDLPPDQALQALVDSSRKSLPRDDIAWRAAIGVFVDCRDRKVESPLFKSCRTKD